MKLNTVFLLFFLEFIYIIYVCVCVCSGGGTAGFLCRPAAAAALFILPFLVHVDVIFFLIPHPGGHPSPWRASLTLEGMAASWMTMKPELPPSPWGVLHGTMFC